MRTQKILNRFLKIVVDLHAEKFFLSVFYLAGCSNDVADINALHLSWRCPWRIKPERDCVCEHWCVLVHVRSEAWLLLSEQRGKKRRLSTFPGVACLSVRLADCVFVCLFLFSPHPSPMGHCPVPITPPPPHLKRFAQKNWKVPLSVPQIRQKGRLPRRSIIEVWRRFSVASLHPRPQQWPMSRALPAWW